jgi:cytoskeleton protein RodZ
MARYDDEHGLAIGDVLKSARTAQGLDIRTVEDRTKIRTKYLRALENEEWDVLPSNAYAKGFLRTYAQLLALDADALVDEYRRQVESGLAGVQPPSFGEPVLEGRPRLPGREPRRWSLAAIVAAVAVGLVAVLWVIGLVGGGDEGGGKGRHEHKRELAQERRQRERRQERKQQQQQQQQAGATVTMRIDLNSDVQVCLVGDDKTQPLVDDQVLAAGSVEGPYVAKQFDLRFPFGYDVEQFDLFLNGKPARLPETQGPVAYRITPPANIQPEQFPGAGCP